MAWHSGGFRDCGCFDTSLVLNRAVLREIWRVAEWLWLGGSGSVAVGVKMAVAVAQLMRLWYNLA
jgi:hypothetical protein